MRKWFHQWQELDPILADGEVGEIIGMLVTKTGDGKTPWRQLSYTPTEPPPPLEFDLLADVDLLNIANLDSTTPGTLATDGSGWIKKTFAQFKSSLGLGDVDNTADVDKPVSSAQQTVLNAKADLVGGVVPTSQIPAIALNTSVPVASQAAMLALSTAQVQPGDVAVRADGAGTFMLMDSDPSVLGNWLRLDSQTDLVTSVNGQTATVVLGKSDVDLGNVDNTADADKPVSSATQAALDAKIAKSLVTTKGDIIAATASATPARLAVGTNGHVLTADSTQSAGVKWAAAAGGSAFPQTLTRAGSWVSTSATPSSATPAVGELFACPIYFASAVTLDRLAISVTASAASSTVRLGIYSDNGSGSPGALLLDAGTVDASTTGDKTVTISQAIPAGLCWFASVSQGGAPSVRTTSATSGGVFSLSSNTQQNAMIYSIVGYQHNGSVSGALPANFTLPSEKANVHRVAGRVV